MGRTPCVGFLGRILCAGNSDFSVLKGILAAGAAVHLTYIEIFEHSLVLATGLTDDGVLSTGSDFLFFNCCILYLLILAAA